MIFDFNLLKNNINIPDKPGIYCLQVKDARKLPDEFAAELDRRKKFLYIGMASKSLKKRLGQELQAKGPGTFFRSLGAVLGYLPERGSLRYGSNYKFSSVDRDKIIEWINSNINLSWNDDWKDMNKKEKKYIKKYCPLLNLKNNPLSSKRLKELRAECLRVAKDFGCVL
ncbi:MAG: hypothetical protein V1867_02540 [Candidatus Falkowbacteria bacterium]